ncbi:LysR family transcriptional regulator [Bordetella genomosp. 13]|uniref:LysR family transcriptional regulator n=1 Tax=Bordetella genomosp. 13 TaxID=463040 RepID=A0A1W6Z8Z6_9BORD|nr:LysR substrate-binding domain-containing protein [Bordetella genomosp. 13]ARP93878.1 LysR family transcriptional regulator [Bordetella genomosp. 13]
MELAELEIFRAVAREQSVTRAAQLLDRVQSNVTTRLKQLEDDLGVALFLRDGRRMTLTPQGQRFLDYAERILALAEEARQSMQSEQPSGRLRVGSMESTAASRLPRPLARFHANWPEVNVEIRTGTTQLMADAVAEHRLDCAIVAHPDAGPASTADMALLAPGLRGTYLFSEKLMLVLPPGHPKVRAPSDIQVRSLAGFARGCTYRQCAEDWLGQEGTGLPRWNVVEVNSYHAILACVMAGTAVAVLPQSVLDLHPDAAAMRTVFLRDAHIFFVQRAGYDTAACRALLEEVRRQDAQVRPPPVI